MGGDFVTYDKNFTATDNSFSGHSNVYHLMANGMYYFSATETFQPYVGGGFGNTQVSFHSGTGPNASLSGNEFHATVGFNLQLTKKMGLKVEYKRIDFSLDDAQGDKLKTSADLLSAGLTITF